VDTVDPVGDVWMVRHGATEWSEAGRHTSRTDVPLLPVGEEAARAVASRLASHSFELVLTSPLERARRTAELAGFEEAEVDHDLKEWDYGSYEGITTDEIRESVPDWTVFSHPSPGGETAAQVGARADRVVARCHATSGDVLLFGHGHTLRVVTARWLELDVTGGQLFVLQTATVSVLGHERESPAVLHWNA
jgi:broad specificity phosphatase PhoE